MMNAAFARAKAIGYKQVELEVIAGNDRAMRLYERFGFVQTGTIPCAIRYDDGAFCDALISAENAVKNVSADNPAETYRLFLNAVRPRAERFHTCVCGENSAVFEPFAHLQLGSRRSFVFPIPLPPEIANGMIVLPVRSRRSRKDIDDVRRDVPPDREGDEHCVISAPRFIGTFAISGRADGSRISKVERECLSIQFKSARMYGAFG